MLNCSSVIMCRTASLWAERHYRICAGPLIECKVTCECIVCAHVLYGLSHVTSLRDLDLCPSELFLFSHKTIHCLHLGFWACLYKHIGLFKIYHFFTLYIVNRTAAHKNWIGNIYCLKIFFQCIIHFLYTCIFFFMVTGGKSPCQNALSVQTIILKSRRYYKAYSSYKNDLLVNFVPTLNNMCTMMSITLTSEKCSQFWIWNYHINPVKLANFFIS